MSLLNRIATVDTSFRIGRLRWFNVNNKGFLMSIWGRQIRCSPRPRDTYSRNFNVQFSSPTFLNMLGLARTAKHPRTRRQQRHARERGGPERQLASATTEPTESQTARSSRDEMKRQQNLRPTTIPLSPSHHHTRHIPACRATLPPHGIE